MWEGVQGYPGLLQSNVGLQRNLPWEKTKGCKCKAYCNNNAQCAVTQRWMPMDRQNHNCTEAKTLENSSTVTSGISLFCLDQSSVHFKLNIKWEFRVLWNRVITSNVPERNSWIWKRKQVRQIVWAHAPVMSGLISEQGWIIIFQCGVCCCEWVHFNPKHDLFRTLTKQLLMAKPTQMQQSTVKCDCKWNRSAKIQNKKVKPRSKSAGFARRHQKSI